MQAGGKLCLAVVIFLAGVCFAAPHPRYRVVDLGVLPNGTSSVATALNDKGEVVGDCETPNGVHGFLFSGGEMIDLTPSLLFFYHGFYFTATESRPRDINNRGEIIGVGRLFSFISPQFLYSNGVVSLFPGYLSVRGERLPYLFAINDVGHILGVENHLLPVVTDRENVWPYPVVPGGQILVERLNNHDEATGSSSAPFGNSRFHPIIARTNEIMDIPLPSDALWGAGWDINDSGHVVGSYAVLTDGTEVGRGFFYRDGLRTDIPGSALVAVNNFDEAVGIGISGPFVFIDGSTYPLNQTIPLGLGFTIGQVNDINNNGVIAGSAFRNGQEHAVVLIPLNRKFLP